MSTDKEQPAEKRIIIDEDWKSQVQAEKEQAEKKVREPTKPERAPLPPASFPLLLTTLATQAMVGLGAVPNPLTNKAERDLEQAKHFIDLLGILEERTKGNLTAEERRLLDAFLFDLRLQYVEASSTEGTT